MGEILVIFFGGVLLNNFILSRILGVCPFIGVSKQVETATGMGMAVVFVMGVASVVTWTVQHYMLVPLGLGYLQTIAFILVIAALVQLVEMVIQKVSPVLYKALGIYLPLITTNCAVLGVAILNITEDYDLLGAAVNGIAGASGFTLAIILFAAIRERMDLAPIPESLKGFPMALITAGLMSIAFLGFAGFRLKELFGVM
ncbi:MAG: electron transport complex subunit RsxA [Firmicutes bacterium]|jgi:electron transport complex protein RnfA|nr:electron transport complex subunit RsxA [Bacillota bacterium]MDH7494970.1 electron transport complex subunit RsxA [Bacillota bacterium]